MKLSALWAPFFFLGLLCAWGAMVLGRRPPGARFTYGFGRSSVLAALANAILLLVACGAIAWEAFGRLPSPPPVAGLTVMAVATVGIAINGVSAWLLHAGSHDDLNRRSAFIHMLSDAAVSAGVVVSGAVIWFTGWELLDREARVRLRTALAARKLVDFSGPHGWEHSASNLGHTVPLASAPCEGVSATQRLVLPLVELRADFEVSLAELRDADRGAGDPDLAELDRAAHRIVVAMEHGEASTEDERLAMQHFRALFDDLLSGDGDREIKSRDTATRTREGASR